MRKLHVIKVGGKIVEQEESLKVFLDEFHALKGLKVLVHGGGVLASTIGEKLGIPAKMIEGRRVTNAETLDVVTMVYGGLINKKLVARLQALGQNAIGLTGADLNLIEAIKRNPIPVDFGWVGDIHSVQINWIKVFLEQGIVPVIAPLTHDAKGHLLNTNADTIAGTLASVLAGFYEVQLLFCFEQKGVLSEGGVLPIIDQNGYRELKEKGTIVDGMIPKLDLSFEALEAGVSSVRILHFSAMNSTNSGTEVQ